MLPVSSILPKNFQHRCRQIYPGDEDLALKEGRWQHAKANVEKLEEDLRKLDPSSSSIIPSKAPKRKLLSVRCDRNFLKLLQVQEPRKRQQSPQASTSYLGFIVY